MWLLSPLHSCRYLAALLRRLPSVRSVLFSDYMGLISPPAKDGKQAGAGGVGPAPGGERVLWVAIAALARAAAAGDGAAPHRPLRILVFTGDVGVPPTAIVAAAASRFATLSTSRPVTKSGPPLPAAQAAASLRNLVRMRSRPSTRNRPVMLGPTLVPETASRATD